MLPPDMEQLLLRIRQLGPPKPQLLGSSYPRPSTGDLRNGRFIVHGHAALLAPPIDWLQDPHHNRSWCYQLHSLTWLTPALVAHAESGDPFPLEVAVSRIGDWIAAHHKVSDEISDFAWNDMAISQRTPSLAYALRAGLQADLLADDLAGLFLEMCERHGSELADSSKYSEGHNHGLAQDEALYLLAEQLPIFPAAKEWSQIARRRLRVTLGATINEDEGTHLEHSSSYQFAIAGLLSRLSENISTEPYLAKLSEQIHQTAAWHVTPSGRMAQLGDTDDTPAPGWAVEQSLHQRGLIALYDSGAAFVRNRRSYLAVSSAYHSKAHKHSDDSGCLLVSNGMTVLADPGRWSYSENELDRRYARSAHAHNVLIVDDKDFDWRTSTPYGSGLLASSASDGWYLILVTNPLLARQGVAHRRLFLYRPTQILVIIDDVRSHDHHEYARCFHFGPQLAVERGSSQQLVLTSPKFNGVFTDLSESPRIHLSHGQNHPRRSGWIYPNERKRLPTSTVELQCRAANASLAVSLTLQGDKPKIHRAALNGNQAVVEVDSERIEVQLLPAERRAALYVDREKS